MQKNVSHLSDTYFESIFSQIIAYLPLFHFLYGDNLGISKSNSPFPIL